MGFRRCLARAALSVAVAALLAACAEKPPECADPQSVSLATEVVREAVGKTVLAVATHNMPAEPRAAMSKLVDNYLAGLRYELGEIVSDGYSREARKHTCAGRFTVRSTSAEPIVVRSGYTIQMTQDQQGRFLLTVQQAEAIAQAAVADFAQALQQQALAGLQAQANGTTAQPASTPAGTASFRSEHGSLQLKPAAGALAFEMDAAIEHHTCSLAGTAQFANGATAIAPGVRATFRSTDKGTEACTAVFDFKSADTVEVFTQECSAFCGMKAQGALDAVYRRGS